MRIEDAYAASGAIRKRKMGIALEQNRAAPAAEFEGLERVAGEDVC